MEEWQKLKIGYGSPPSSLSCLLGQVETSVFGVIGHHIGALFRLLSCLLLPRTLPLLPRLAQHPLALILVPALFFVGSSIWRHSRLLWISQFRLVPSTSIPRGSQFSLPILLLIMGPRVHNLWCYSGGNGHSVTGKVCGLGPVYGGCTQPRSRMESDYG